MLNWSEIIPASCSSNMYWMFNVIHIWELHLINQWDVVQEPVKMKFPTREYSFLLALALDENYCTKSINQMDRNFNFEMGVLVEVK